MAIIDLEFYAFSFMHQNKNKEALQLEMLQQFRGLDDDYLNYCNDEDDDDCSIL